MTWILAQFCPKSTGTVCQPNLPKSESFMTSSFTVITKKHVRPKITPRRLLLVRCKKLTDWLPSAQRPRSEVWRYVFSSASEWPFVGECSFVCSFINAVTLEPFELRYRHEIFTGAKAPLMAKMAAACSVGGGLTLWRSSWYWSYITVINRVINHSRLEHNSYRT